MGRREVGGRKGRGKTGKGRDQGKGREKCERS